MYGLQVREVSIWIHVLVRGNREVKVQKLADFWAFSGKKKNALLLLILLLTFFHSIENPVWLIDLSFSFGLNSFHCRRLKQFLEVASPIHSDLAYQQLSLVFLVGLTQHFSVYLFEVYQLSFLSSLAFPGFLGWLFFTLDMGFGQQGLLVSVVLSKLSVIM